VITVELMAGRVELLSNAGYFARVNYLGGFKEKKQLHYKAAKVLISKSENRFTSLINKTQEKRVKFLKLADQGCN
jgi:hypothetical protein